MVSCLCKSVKVSAHFPVKFEFVLLVSKRLAWLGFVVHLSDDVGPFQPARVPSPFLNHGVVSSDETLIQKV